MISGEPTFLVTKATNRIDRLQCLYSGLYINVSGFFELRYVHTVSQVKIFAWAHVRVKSTAGNITLSSEESFMIFFLGIN